ncbi:MAG: TIGR03936 family radical SAM-associated protein, partial [Caldicoprobacteraceae bacterium]
SKGKKVKYISHLELMRTIHRALRRADIPVAFSRGYNPQPKTAFAMPLPVGMTSEGEYMDIILDSHLCPEIFCQRMNDALPDGIMLLKAVEVGESLPSLMSLIDRAVYLITVHNPPKDIDIKLNRFLQQNEIVIKKDSKRGERFVNIKPMILKADILGSQETDTAMEVVLSTGSREYLNPEHMIKAFLAYAEGDDFEAYFNIHRVDMLIPGNDGCMAPLELGKGG